MVVHCAGLVGGLGANTARPGEFFFQNLAMALNLIEGARQAGLHELGGKFVMVGSMTSYPGNAPIPFREDDLFGGYPEPRSAPYGIAKLAALEMLRAYHSQHGLKSAYVVPMNLYGPGDNLDPATSHFVGALVDRCVNAHRRKEPRLVCWGTGTPLREFLYVEDGAEGVLRAAETMDGPTPINLSPGAEYSIREVVDLIVRLVGYRGEVVWDPSKPDGQPRRCLDGRRAQELLGWTAQVSLEGGLKRTIQWRMSLGNHGEGAPY
jgi:nucleoside-diphosphate-sugar epimerase